MRIIALIALALVGTAAQAQVSFVDFKWRADTRFELRVNAARTQVSFKGALKDDEKITVEAGSYNLDLKSYGSPVNMLIAVVTEDGRDLGHAFILERQNAEFVLMNQRAIIGRSASMGADLESAVTGLNQKNRWDAALALRAVVAYFTNNPGKQTFEFLNEVENERVATIPKPLGREQSATSGSTVTAGPRVIPSPGRTVPGGPLDDDQVDMQGPPRNRRTVEPAETLPGQPLDIRPGARNPRPSMSGEEEYETPDEEELRLQRERERQRRIQAQRRRQLEEERRQREQQYYEPQPQQRGWGWGSQPQQPVRPQQPRYYDQWGRPVPPRDVPQPQQPPQQRPGFFPFGGGQQQQPQQAPRPQRLPFNIFD